MRIPRAPTHASDPEKVATVEITEYCRAAPEKACSSMDSIRSRVVKSQPTLNFPSDPPRFRWGRPERRGSEAARYPQSPELNFKVPVWWTGQMRWQLTYAKSECRISAAYCGIAGGFDRRQKVVFNLCRRRKWQIDFVRTLLGLLQT